MTSNPSPVSAPDSIPGWASSSHSHGPHTFPVYRRGAGPGVVIIHEAPGLTEGVIDFANHVVDWGYTVVLPHLFGELGGSITPKSVVTTVPKLCVSKEFTTFATGVTAPLADWLRSLARDLSNHTGGPVGALGMCITGGFALAMMVDESVTAPVVAQPSAPLPIGKKRAADINLSPTDQRAIVARDCPVLGLRYAKDAAVGTRFETLRTLLGENFIHVDLPGKGHSTLTEHRSETAMNAVQDFFATRLGTTPPS